ncbi:MAG: hypothetical protein O3A00_27780, partial [Planctomycetota bacterium]|nr:hypothetical protein [Planctomycetota bacterium]
NNGADNDIAYGAGDQIEVINIITTDLALDTINIQSTFLNSVYNIDTGVLGAFDDVVNVSSDAPLLTTAATTNLDGIQGQLNFGFGAGAGGLGATRLNISDFGDATGAIYDLITNATMTELYINDGPAATNAAGLTTALGSTPDVRYNVALNTITLPTAFFRATVNQLANFQLIGADANAADNTYNIYNTTGTVSNTISDGDGSVAGAGTDNQATFNIQADDVQSAAANTFQGFDGTDTFNTFLDANQIVPNAAGTTFVINGGELAATTAQRDTVNIYTGFNITSPGAGAVPTRNANADGAARVGLGFTYADMTKTSGDLDITGLGAAAMWDLNTVEQVNYFGSGAAPDDQITVTGTTATNDILTVTPLTASSANVFLDGEPLIDTGTAPFNSPATNNPGVNGDSGGFEGPDLNLNGLAQATGLTFNSGNAVGAGDRLVVNAPTEDLGIGAPQSAGWNGFDSTDALGNVLLNSTVRGAAGSNTAFDDITINDTSVIINNRGDGSGNNLLLQTNFITASFNGSPLGQAEVIVNSGEEQGTRTAGLGAALVADDVTVVLSTTIHFQVNGGAPPLPGTPPLVGDRLNVLPLPGGNINLFADADPDNDTQVAPTDNAPRVSITSANTGGTSQPASYNNIELVTVRPDNATEEVNIIGDDNGANLNQQDEIIVLGQDVDSLIPNALATDPAFGIAHPVDADGANEFVVLINGSSPIFVYNTAFLNISGQGGDDDITIDPYANDITGGWDIDVTVDGDGTLPGITAGDDDIFYGNIDFDRTLGSGGAGLQPGLIFVDASPNGSQSGVSENVNVFPTATPRAGQIRSTNAADSTDIVTIDFVNTEDLSFFFNDGTAGDTDTLTVHGTAGVDAIVANFTLDGNDTAAATANPGAWIDINAGNLQIERVTAASANALADSTQNDVATINFALGDQDDSITITSVRDGVILPDLDGPAVINVDGGAPTASDTIFVAGTAAADDQYTVSPGASSDSGTIAFRLSGATADTIVNFTTT